MKRPIRMTALAATVALLAWTGVWFYAKRHIEMRFAAWVDAQREAGIEIAYRTAGIGGWPFGWRLTVDAPEAKGAGAAGWAWSGERLVAALDPRDLGRVAMTLPGLQVVRFGAGDLATRIETRAARPDGALRFDERGRVERLDLDLGSLEMKIDSMAEPLTAQTLVLMLAPHRPDNPTYRTDTLDLKFVAAGLRLPAPVAPLAALGRDIAAAELDARVQGRIAGTKLAEAVAAWRDDGGTLEIAKAAIAWGPLHLTGDGTLALDAENRPLGAATARIAGFAETIDALAGAGAIPPGTAALMKIALTVMARQDPQEGNRPTVRVPMTAQDGQFGVHSFRLFRLPPLALD